jgi:flagellar motor switch protein FliG
MREAIEPSKEPGADYAKLTHVQKLAILLIMLGAESAAQILKHLDDHELEAVTAEMARTSMVNQAVQEEILREFTGIAVGASTAVRGGFEFAQAALEKGVGQYKASDVFSKVSPGRAPEAAIKWLSELDAPQIYNLIRNEQPQTIALVVSYLAPAKASQLLGMLPAEDQQQVTERLATLAPTPIEVVERIINVLTRRIGGKHTRAMSRTGGLNAAAGILKSLDKSVRKALLEGIGQNNPELGQALSRRLFVFEDLVQVEPVAIQKILREVDQNDLIISLSNASDQLKSLLLGAISKRAAENVLEEMNCMKKPKVREIEAAQGRIIEQMRNLESSGEIELSETEEINNEALA